jgi:ABC-2 type transport system ATP-binding protein
LPILHVSHVSKNFNDVRAVQDLAFTVEKGEIFGLLGPNGAGKTTTIRLILNLFPPDLGKVSIMGGELTDQVKNKIGYMPEERGLYQDITLERALIYLASLKGVPSKEARRRMIGYLERFGLAEYSRKKVKELSRGMQQKAQIIATILHQPELIFVDEPFSGLDPVNTQLVKDTLLELQYQGSTIIMSTHQLNKVEELCQRILILNNGKSIIYGELEDIRKQFSGNAVCLQTENELPIIPGVNIAKYNNSNYQLELVGNTSPQFLLQHLVEKNVELKKFEVITPSLDEIFIMAVGGDRAQP